MAEEIIIPHLPWIIGGGLVLGFLAISGWIFTTWLRIKHGYPLENSWGKALEPRVTTETAERLKLITAENAQLRAELSAVKERVATVERIVTDDGHRLTQEIEALRIDRRN
ncbi:MAG: hypothetical protein ACK4K7_11295 [Allosphingosinicella sp.]|uniref:hypothetical protein n=1 Tax=Allosphingosinicella sp. TaxID=2823234 RepID=UPI003934760C